MAAKKPDKKKKNRKKPLKKTRASSKSQSSSSSKHPFTVVGVGASAGGLEAFKSLLQAIPADSGMAYVLVQHLHPRHESLLPEILSRVTKIPVHEIIDNVEIEENHIYIVPENNILKSVDGVLKLIPRDGGSPLPIDFFFKSLAEVYRKQAVGIVLSGTANDGTLGLKAIKDAGGITLAQDETTAAYTGMPSSAINAGVVDFILPPEKMPEHLIYLKQGKSPPAKKAAIPKLSDEDAIKQILFILRSRAGVDFTFYKRTTLNRRLQRRMKHHHKTNLSQYLDLLRHSKIEVDSLYQDFLITVTSFFREPETFKLLSTDVFPELLKLKKNIRIWIVGCSGGQEAYSMAMCLAEFLGNRISSVEVKIFATDLSAKEIAKARLGIYSKGEMEGVSPSRIARFFVKTDGDYHVSKALRDMCVFAPHNLLNDPPFSKVDLISCRNVLIYMEPLLQKKALGAFHYSLNERGYLLLGNSETVTSAPSLFTPLDKHHKLYQKTKPTAQSYIPPGYHTPASVLKVEREQKEEETLSKTSFQKMVDDILLTKYTPASIVVNEAMEIMQFRGATGRFLEPTPGRASLNLVKMARHELVFDLRAAIQKAKLSKKPVKKQNILLPVNGHKLNVTIEILPMLNLPEALYLILFKEQPLVQETRETRKKREDAKDARIHHLEDEITMMREDLRMHTEEQEAINEEYQSANEELLSGREEMQSINEELETSKEELQSANEELMTVNQELQTRNQELADSRKYAEAIIATLHLPLVTLDSRLRVRSANTAFHKIFNTREEEIEEKYFFDITNERWNVPELRQLLEKLLSEKKPFVDIELTHVFAGIGRRTLLLNGRQIDRSAHLEPLVLLSITDITEKKAADLLVREKRDEFLGIASHELKTPLTTMKAMIQLLYQNAMDENNTAFSEPLAKMNKQADKLTKLVRDLLDYSKIESGRLKLETGEFMIDELVKETISDLQPASHHNIVFMGGIKKKVVGDQERVSQVLNNLLTNAMKYSPKADKVIVDVKEADGMAVISVQDFGIGLSAEDQQKVFNRYFRSKDASRIYPGFGVGLYVSAELVKEMKGKLWVESRLGAGATLCFSLPLAEAQQGKE